MAEKAAKKSFGKRVKSFFVEIKSELAKATWPTKEQLLHNTGIILVFIAVVTIVLSLLDIAFTKLFQYLNTLL